MKKLGKALLLIILLAGFSMGGFFLGANSRLASPLGGMTKGDAESRRMNRIMENIKSYAQTIQRDYIFDYKEEDLELGLYKGLFSGLQDPYSEFYSANEFQELLQDTAGSFSGVGLVVTAGPDNLIQVVSPIEGGPAAKAGIRTGDKIIAVDGQSFTGAHLNEATKRMRGQAGTQVRVTIRREKDGALTNQDFTLTRAELDIQTVKGRLIEGDVGYIQISQFNQKTASEFAASLKSLENQGAKRLVIDLRNNPGGLLDSTVEISDSLLGEGTIVTTVNKKKQEQVTKSDAAHSSLPIVLLVNGGSASASEIMTGALKDHHRALVVGEKTYGKGIVQRLYPLGQGEEGGGFKLTMAEYLTPSGAHIHKKGIEPDFVVQLPETAKGLGPDFLSDDLPLQTAIAYAKALQGEEVHPDQLPPANAVLPNPASSATEGTSSSQSEQLPASSESSQAGTTTQESREQAPGGSHDQQSDQERGNPIDLPSPRQESK